MKIIVLRYSELEDKRFYIDMSIKETFFTDHNLTEKEALEKPYLEILVSPFNLGTYLHSDAGPAYYLGVKEDCTSAKGDKLVKDQVLHKEYWLEGKRLTGVEESEFVHSLSFNGKFKDLINE